MNKSSKTPRKNETTAAPAKEEVKVEAPAKEAKVTKKAAPAKEAPVAEEKPAKKSKKTEEKPAEAPAAEEKPAKKSKKAAKVEEDAPAAEEATETAEATEKKARREVTRETVDADFDAMIALINERLALANADDKKNGAAKVFRTLLKGVKTLKGDISRISRQKTRTVRQNSSSSGFMKPVKISDEMAKFTGWDAGQLRSRVEVTKFICDYVKSNNLQKEDDRRQIVPDSKLAKLLKYDSKKEEKPLTYYYLQQKIQPHFTAAEAK